MTYLRRPQRSHPPRTPQADSEPIDPPASMPPRLSPLLHPGFNTRIVHVSSRARARQISESRYPPYAPMYELLRGKSMLQVARETGLPYPAVSKILRGCSEPPFYAGMLIARAVGCTPEELDAYLSARQRAPLRPQKLAETLSRAEAATRWRRDMTETLPPE